MIDLDAALAPYDFPLPDEQIARFPPPQRTDARLMVVGPPHRHGHIPDLPDLLRPGDLLVLNDVRVQRARLRAQRSTGGKVELLLTQREGDRFLAMVRPARRLDPGERLRCGPGEVVMEARTPEGHWWVRLTPDADAVLASGEVPLPPYLGRAPTPEDDARYQTVYARAGFASAAPTAGLHFTPALLAQLTARGVAQAMVTLEVGPGTFEPLRPHNLAEGRLHAERWFLPDATRAAIAATRAHGGRVIAVGTTAARVLESADDAPSGITTLFIRPGYRFRAVDLLLTNFHLPRSSLLMMVCAFGGMDRIMSAYAEAVRLGYRFFSYGDAMLVAKE